MSAAQVILIEGADATGKSSFVTAMAGLHLTGGTPVPRVVHNTAEDARRPGSLVAHYRRQIDAAVRFRELGVSTYIDRSFLSEHIYGTLYRGKPRITARQARRLERYALRRGVILLGLTADLADRRDRMVRRGEDWSNRDAYVGAFYNHWFAEQANRWILADSSSAHTVIDID